MNEPEKVYLGLGSNLGNRLKNLAFALEKLKANARIRVGQISSVYETEPYGFRDQPSFLNCAIEVNTSLPPTSMLIVAKSIEEQLGRSTAHRWGPREIDVDILAYEQNTTHLDFLQVPHRAISDRRFVLVPLAEIAPNFIPPGYHRSISELLRDCQDTAKVQVLGPAHLLEVLIGEEFL